MGGALKKRLEANLIPQSYQVVMVKMKSSFFFSLEWTKRGELGVKWVLPDLEHETGTKIKPF